jgi:branched-subunit amino acid permease
MEIIVSAKDRQTAEANKKASLLEELDKECVGPHSDLYTFYVYCILITLFCLNTKIGMIH